MASVSVHSDTHSGLALVSMSSHWSIPTGHKEWFLSLSLACHHEIHEYEEIPHESTLWGRRDKALTVRPLWIGTVFLFDLETLFCPCSERERRDKLETIIRKTTRIRYKNHFHSVLRFSCLEDSRKNSLSQSLLVFLAFPNLFGEIIVNMNLQLDDDNCLWLNFVWNEVFLLWFVFSPCFKPSNAHQRAKLFGSCNELFRPRSSYEFDRARCGPGRACQLDHDEDWPQLFARGRGRGYG